MGSLFLYELMGSLVLYELMGSLFLYELMGSLFFRRNLSEIRCILIKVSSV